MHADRRGSRGTGVWLRLASLVAILAAVALAGCGGDDGGSDGDGEGAPAPEALEGEAAAEALGAAAEKTNGYEGGV